MERLTLSREELCTILQAMQDDIKLHGKAKTKQEQEERYQRVWNAMAWVRSQENARRAGAGIYYLQNVASRVPPGFLNEVHSVSVLNDGKNVRFETRVSGPGGSVLITPT